MSAAYHRGTSARVPNAVGAQGEKGESLCCYETSLSSMICQMYGILCKFKFVVGEFDNPVTFCTQKSRSSNVQVYEHS